MVGIVEKAATMADVNLPNRADRPSPVTFATLLGRLLGDEPGRPLVTYYGYDADGAVVDRTELSTTTYANWVAKAAGLLTDELDLERGDRLLLDLPTHWLTPVLWGAAWTAGLVVVLPEDLAAGAAGGSVAEGDLAAVVCGPASLDRWADRADDLVVLACALTPLGRPFAGGVPDGVHDVGVEIWSLPDAYVAIDPPTPEDEARPGRVQGDLLSPPEGPALRVLTTDLSTVAGLDGAVGVLAAGGSLVLVDPAAPSAPWWPEKRSALERDERLEGGAA